MNVPSRSAPPDDRASLEAATGVPSPYDAPDLYDQLFESLDFDAAFLIETARKAGGPVLEVGCGTGRVLLRLREAGVDADGVEPSAAMLARLHDKAAARGVAVRAVPGDARDFSLPRRYALVMWVFNGFSHLLALEDQLAALRNMGDHLAPGGAVLVHLSQPPADAWVEPHVERALEHETTLPGGNTLRIYDTRTKERAAQTQHSAVEIEEIDAAGILVRSHRSETMHRWVYRHELELLLRHAGFARVEIRGDDGAGPVTADSEQMWGFGWKEPRP